MKRKTRNAARTKQEIIEKSAPIFNVYGYAGTSMKMLVEASGYQMGGIYRHFETKMDLAKAVFQYNYESLIKPNLDVDHELNAREKLLGIIENYKKMVMQPVIQGGCPILNTAIEMDDTDAEFRKLTKDFFEEILSALEQIMKEGQANGMIRSEIDTRKTALYCVATFEGAIMIGKLTRNPKAIFDIFDQTAQYLKNSVF